MPDYILRTMDDVSLEGKRVLVRVDFNVNYGGDNIVDATEDYRLEPTIATIGELQEKNCKVLLLTHLGRPSQGDSPDIEPVRRRLEDLLGAQVLQLSALFGEAVRAEIDGMGDGEVALYPNVREDPREKEGNARFAKEIAANAEVFVSEAFSVSHRAHSSVAYVPQFLPSCAGRQVMREISSLKSLRDNPKRPYVAIISGAKVETKTGMLRSLLGHVDHLCLGGRLANVFLAARGDFDVAKYDVNEVEAAKSIIKEHRFQVVLPEDVIVGSDDGSGGTMVKRVDQVSSADGCACDVGPQTVATFTRYAKEAETVMWNGPLGKYEVEAYVKGTADLARNLVRLDNYRVIGGGDTVNMVEKLGVVNDFDYVSTGGGAMIAYLEGKNMPGLQVLSAG